MCIRDRSYPALFNSGPQNPPASDLPKPPVNGDLAQIVYPVSYTHLDVYKRQAIDIDEMLAVLKEYNVLNWDATLPPWGAAK